MIEQTYQQWVQDAKARLQTCSDSPQLDARLLLCHSLGISKSSLLAWPDKKISSNDIGDLSTLLDRRLSGEPMAYIIGEAEFWGLRFKVNPSVLIPRPETELIVESVLAKATGSDIEDLHILDCGTGSGAIAIALASELPSARIQALDLSSDAIEIARQNAILNQTEQIIFLHSHWFDALSPKDKFNIIVSNPPYIAEGDPHLDDLTFEPKMALTAKRQGLADIETLVSSARKHLQSHGWLMIEHGYNQGNEVRHIFERFGYNKIETIKDLAHHERITIAQHE